MFSRHPERIVHLDAGIRQRIIEPFHTLHSRILDIRSDDCDASVPAGDQLSCRPHHRGAVVDLHAVIFFVSQCTVNKHDRDLRLPRSLKELSFQADGKDKDSIHLAADQELKIFSFQPAVIAGIADQHPVAVLMQCLPQIMEHIPYKDTLDVINKNADRPGPVCDKPSCQFIYFIMKFFDRFFDQFPVLRKDIPPVEILRDGRQRQSGPVPDIADRCSHFLLLSGSWQTVFMHFAQCICYIH